MVIGWVMGNKFVIGERVIRKMTETAHVIQDLNFKDSVETLHVATGEFKTVEGTWLYMVDGVPSWIVEDALMKIHHEKSRNCDRQRISDGLVPAYHPAIVQIFRKLLTAHSVHREH